ncbi:MAG: LacI family DNA-binding transcriptional regulator [Rhodobacter sp.]|nr:LacI family DNA-binding transcriptional regulator [Rhodobacter sp.]
MKERPTIHTVAKAAGVSISTVSQVMREQGRISEETRRKVKRAAEKVNYIRDQRAAAMRSGDSREVGLLIHNIRNPFNAEVVVGANAYLEEHGYLVFVLDALDDPERQRRYLRTMMNSSPGGLLWVPALGTDQDTVDWVRDQGKATVTLLRPPPGHPFDHVGIDSTLGAMLATRHLLSLGHRQVAFLGGDHRSETILQRVGGYVSAMLSAGTGDTVVRECAESKAAAMEATVRLIGDRPDVTGLVCNCDVVAAGATLGLMRLGLQVGHDVSVTGFDDIEDARLWSPPLTTVAVDPRGIGRQLAEALLMRKRAPDGAVRSVNLPVRLVVRDSSGQPLGRDM